MVWPSSSNARLDYTIAFFLSSWSKNIYGSPHSESKRINCDFRKLFCSGHAAELARPVPEPARPVWLQQNQPSWFQNLLGRFA
jgi:hypothetical protein